MAKRLNVGRSHMTHQGPPQSYGGKFGVVAAIGSDDQLFQLGRC